MKHKFLPVLVLLSLSCAPLWAQNLISNGDFSNGQTGWEVGSYGTQKANSEVVAAMPGADGAQKALKVVVAPEDKLQKWAIYASQPLQKAVADGEFVKIGFWARSPESSSLAAMLEVVKAPNRSALYREFALSPQWQHFETAGTVEKGFALGDGKVHFHLSFAPATVEITGVQVSGIGETRAGVPTPDAPQLLIQNGDFSKPLDPMWDIVNRPALQSEVVNAQGPPSGKALQLKITPPADAKPWDVQIGQKFGAFVGTGEVVTVRFWARSPQSVSLSLVAELAVQPYEKFLSRNLKLTPNWKEYSFTAQTARPYEAGGAQFKWFLGATTGTVEIADVRVENQGRAELKAFPETVDYWGGQINSDAWRGPALARIERLRKGDLRVRVVDGKGRSVPGAKVKVAMTRHAFRFGTEGQSKWILGTDADSQKYREVLKQNFNTFVFGNELKWPTIERDPNNFKNVDAALRWLKSNRFQVRGHNLQWGSWQYSPHFLRSAPVEETRASVETHTSSLARRFAGQVYIWDAVNEAATERELWDKIGWDEFARTFQLARAADPKAQLCYNDFNISNESASGPSHRQTVEKRIQFLLDKGAPLDVIGDQSHMDAPLTPIKRVLEIWDEMGRFGKPLEVTEFDAAIPDEKVQAAYVRDYLTAAFSHPKMQSFVMWGFWAPQHWRGEDAAMFRKDWSKKPAQLEYENLVLKQWWTRTNGQTGKTGDYRTRGFWGDYTIEVTAQGKTTKSSFKFAPSTTICNVSLK